MYLQLGVQLVVPDLVRVQNEMKSKGVNIVGLFTDTVDDNGKNRKQLKSPKVQYAEERDKRLHILIIPDRTNFNEARLNGMSCTDFLHY